MLNTEINAPLNPTVNSQLQSCRNCIWSRIKLSLHVDENIFVRLLHN